MLTTDAIILAKKAKVKKVKTPKTSTTTTVTTTIISTGTSSLPTTTSSFTTTYVTTYTSIVGRGGASGRYATLNGVMLMVFVMASITSML